MDLLLFYGEHFYRFSESVFYDCRTYENIFRLFGDSANKTKVFNLKVNCKKLRLVFVRHVNRECT